MSTGSYHLTHKGDSTVNERFQVVYVSKDGQLVADRRLFGDAADAWRHLNEVIIGPGLVVQVTAAGEVLPEILEWEDGSCVADIMGELLDGAGWTLSGHDGVIARGTEAAVKAIAQQRIGAAAGSTAEASLREALYLTKPDGSHQGQDAGDGTFVPGEPIRWIDVDW